MVRDKIVSGYWLYLFLRTEVLRIVVNFIDRTS